MSATKEFFETWLQENVGDLPAESEVSVAVLAQQFEQDADAAGYGHEVREDEIGDIEERLRTRFGGGLIADVQPPDLETRIAILRRKAEVDGHAVPDDVLSLIADRFSGNIRELWGALLRVVAFSSVTRHPIDLDLAQSVLKDIFPERSVKPISISVIQQEVCRFYSINKSELVGNKRAQSIVYPRQVAMYLSRELTDHSLPKIGDEFGGRDHTTVMYANTKIQRLMNEQRDVYNQIQTLTNLIRQRN